MKKKITLGVRIIELYISGDTECDMRHILESLHDYEISCFANI